MADGLPRDSQSPRISRENNWSATIAARPITPQVWPSVDRGEERVPHV